MENAADDLSACPGGSTGALGVADVARRARITPATVRYYARIGLLNPHRDKRNGYRRFKDGDLRRVLFIRKAQALGLTIADIQLLLDRIDHRQPVCDQVVELIRARRDEIRQECSELESTRERIESVLERWQEGISGRSPYCPLIDAVKLEPLQEVSLASASSSGSIP